MGCQVHGGREGLGPDGCIDRAAAKAGHVLHVSKAKQAIAHRAQLRGRGVFCVVDVGGCVHASMVMDGRPWTNECCMCVRSTHAEVGRSGQVGRPKAQFGPGGGRPRGGFGWIWGVVDGQSRAQKLAQRPERGGRRSGLGPPGPRARIFGKAFVRGDARFLIFLIGRLRTEACPVPCWFGGRESGVGVQPGVQRKT